MSVWNLVVQEIRHRKWNFVLGLLSVSVAVACLVGSMTLLEADEIRTDEILEEKQAEQKVAIEKKQEEVTKAIATEEAEVKKAGKELQDEMRKITKELGFNILILPKEQDLNELQTAGKLSATMPEEYVKRLSNSKIMTVNHLLPMLTHKTEWAGPKRKQTILVVGTRGEVPLAHRDPKKPLQGGQMVSKGEVVVGFEISKQQGLKPGDTIRLLDRDFKVSKSYPQRGNADDSSVWINLEVAQEILKKQNMIHAILALECNCATIDRIGEIRKDIAKVLPGVQVLETDSRKALARAEARIKAKKFADDALKRVKADGVQQLKREKDTGEADLKRETENRETLQEQRQSFAAILIPLVIVGCAIWIGFLAFANARQRSSEIGILRAIGLQSSQILFIFLSKALLIGVIGSIVGYAVGFGIGLSWSGLPATSATGSQLFGPGLLVLALAMSPLLSALASWFPAAVAARQDPAIVLQGE